ncbi:sulfatase family protein [Gracilibacillus phocaeensis]|uniref:sulfatase family protein n=1 Tax=Gracilibacillus phocaeensis TaxID=2042304 RepID=UPI00102F8195|nr:sulfatase [Gracilibacillus phocaeensis]
MKKPNIIMVISHDTGRYMENYGQHIETPNLKALAEQGIQFNQYYCSQPQCSPSRGSILTGMYSHNHGMMGLAHMGHSMTKEVTTIPSALQRVNYETWLFGFSHEAIDGGKPGRHLGYQHITEVHGNAAKEVTVKLESFLEKQTEEGNDKPFFASVGFEETHLPVDHFEPDPLGSVEPLDYLPAAEGVLNDLAHFHGSVKSLDRAVGDIMTKMRKTGLDKNTVLIYTTDHGIPFPRAKGTLFDAGLETALMMKFPDGTLKQGREINELLCNIDLMPTLLELAGADIPEHIDGSSFLSLLKEEKYKERDSFFCEQTWHDRYHPMRGIRTKEYKYIRNFEDGPKVYLPLDIHQSKAGQAVREEFYVPNAKEELYDLKKDPLEKDNLIEDPDYEAVVNQLREKVDNWMKQTQDPLLEGKVPGFEAEEWEMERKGELFEF